MNTWYIFPHHYHHVAKPNLAKYFFEILMSFSDVVSCHYFHVSFLICRVQTWWQKLVSFNPNRRRRWSHTNCPSSARVQRLIIFDTRVNKVKARPILCTHILWSPNRLPPLNHLLAVREWRHQSGSSRSAVICLRFSFIIGHNERQPAVKHSSIAPLSPYRLRPGPFCLRFHNTLFS